MNEDGIGNTGIGNGRFNGTGHHDPREEILEQVWRLEEMGDASRSRLIQQLPEAEGELARLASEDLLRTIGDELSFTDHGRRIARHIIRANRLAARLMTDVLELQPSFIEQQACRLEHAIGKTLADTLCAFLGHPPTAPDGRAIPPGECCSNPAEGVGPAILPLNRLGLGQTCRVAYIHPREKERLAQLLALGLAPGSLLRFKQRSPSVVVEVGETTLALDGEIAGSIFVKPMESEIPMS